MKNETTPRLTAKEKHVLTAIRENQYRDGDPDLTKAVWSRFLELDADVVTERGLGGVLSSLVKKGLVWVVSAGRESTVGLTPAGIQAAPWHCAKCRTLMAAGLDPALRAAHGDVCFDCRRAAAPEPPPADPVAEAERAGEASMEHSADQSEEALRAAGLSEAELADWFGSDYRGPSPVPPCLGTPRCHGQVPSEHVPACPSFAGGRTPEEPPPLPDHWEAFLRAETDAERAAAFEGLRGDRSRGEVLEELLRVTACLDCPVCRGVHGCVCWDPEGSPFDGATNAGLPTPAEALPLLAGDQEWRSPWAVDPSGTFYRRTVSRSYTRHPETDAWVCYVADRVEYGVGHRGQLRLCGDDTAAFLRRAGGAFRASRTATAAEVRDLEAAPPHPSCYGADYVLLGDVREAA